MRIINLIVFLLLLISLMAFQSCSKFEKIECNYIIYIPDTALKQELRKTWVPDGDREGYLDANNDGEICDGEAARIYDLSIHNKNVRNLEGLEHFHNLNSLDCNNCNIESINFSSSSLKRLECDNNSLIYIDISNMPYLQDLSCDGNNLTHLELPKTNNLRSLFCGNNQLVSIDLHNVNLFSLRIDSNNFSEINIQNQPDLFSLHLNGNQISTLDLSNNPNLWSINIQGNPIEEIDFSQNLELGYIYLGDNQIAFLDLSVNQKLRRISNEGEFTLEKICVWTLPFPPPCIDIFTNISLENFPSDFDGFVICD